MADRYKKTPTLKTVRNVVSVIALLIAMFMLAVHFGLIDIVQMFPDYWNQRNKRVLLSVLEDPSQAYDFEFHEGSSVNCKVHISDPDDWAAIANSIHAELRARGYIEDPEMKDLSDASDGWVNRLESPDGQWFVMFVYFYLSDDGYPQQEFYVIGIYNTDGQDPDWPSS